MTSKKLLSDGTHGPGLGKSPMEGKREGGSEELGKRGGEGRGERKGGLAQVPWMEEGREEGGKERGSKKSVDIWEF